MMIGLDMRALVPVLSQALRKRFSPERLERFGPRQRKAYWQRRRHEFAMGLPHFQ
jgi:hypothetical protein